MEQTAACTADSLHVGVRRIPDREAPNRRRETHGRENGHDHIARHRPRGTAARRRWILLQTQGLSRQGGWLAGIISPPNGRCTAPWAVADRSAIGDRTRREDYDRPVRTRL